MQKGRLISMMKYEIEKRDFGSTWVHVIGKNAKQTSYEKSTIN